MIGSFSVPPAVLHMFHLPEPARPRGSVPLHQRQPVLRTRQTHGTHQRPFEFTADEPTTARPEGKTPTLITPSLLSAPVKHDGGSLMVESAPQFFVVSFHKRGRRLITSK